MTIKFTPINETASGTNIRFTPIIDEEMQPLKNLEDGDGYLKTIMKGLAEGIIELTDLPQNILLMIQEAGRDPGYSEPYDIPSKPIASNAIKGLFGKMGLDIEHKPAGRGEEAAGEIAKFAGGFGPLGLFSKGNKALNVAKNLGLGATTGAVSQGAQMAGIPKDVSDIGSIIATPAVLSGGKGLWNILNPSEEKLSRIARDKLKNFIPEADMPKVLANIDKGLPILSEPTTAELGKHTGLARLERALGPNLSGHSERLANSDNELRSAIDTIGDVSTDVGASGNVIADSLFKNFEAKKALRAKNTKPLLDKMKARNEPIDIKDIKQELEEVSKYEKGTIKSSYKSVIKDLGKSPTLYELHNILKEIGGKIGVAKRAGNNQVAQALEQSKSIIESKLETIEEGLSYRKAYAAESLPLNEMKENALIKSIIEKDQYNKDFKLAPEKISKRLTSSDIRDQEGFVKQIAADENAKRAARDLFMNNFIQNIEQGGVNSSGYKKLSNIKADKFLEKNRNLISNLLNEEQQKTLNDLNEVMQSRQFVSDAGRAVGSNTQADTTLMNSLSSSLLNKIPGMESTIDISKMLGNQRAKKQLEKVLLDPNYARKVMNLKKDNSLPISPLLNLLNYNLDN